MDAAASHVFFPVGPVVVESIIHPQAAGSVLLTGAGGEWGCCCQTRPAGQGEDLQGCAAVMTFVVVAEGQELESRVAQMTARDACSWIDAR